MPLTPPGRPGQPQPLQKPHPPGPSYLLDVEVAAGTGLVEIHPVFPGQLRHQGLAEREGSMIWGEGGFNTPGTPLPSLERAQPGTDRQESCRGGLA